MRDWLKMIARGVALLALIGGLAAPSIGLADDDDHNNSGNKENEESEQFRSERDDRQVSGQVLEINTLADPPEMQIANMDGIIQVRLLTKDLIPRHGVRLGDHVTLFGEKISELAFDSQDLSVDARLGDDINATDDSDDADDWDDSDDNDNNGDDGDDNDNADVDNDNDNLDNDNDDLDNDNADDDNDNGDGNDNN